jgi:hypothetical protein
MQFISEASIRKAQAASGLTPSFSALYPRSLSGALLPTVNQQAALSASSIPNFHWPRFCRSQDHSLPHRLQSQYIISPYPSKLRFSFLLFSLALFAFWLRSSVVSVLFSLISERCLRTSIVIIPIFGLRVVSAVLAHDSAHSVPGITLPPGDANALFDLLVFRCLLGLAWAVRKNSLHFRDLGACLNP